MISLKSFFSILYRIYIVPILEKEMEDEKRKHAKQLAGSCSRSVLPNTVNYDDNTDSNCSNNGSESIYGHFSAGHRYESPFLRSISLTEEALKDRQLSNLLEVIRLICLGPGECIHSKVEKALVCPFIDQRDSLATSTIPAALVVPVDDHDGSVKSPYKKSRLSPASSLF